MISIDREKIDKLSHPYSNCLVDLKNPPNNYASILFDYMNRMDIYNYDQNFCFTICYQDKLINECKCQETVTPRIRKSKYCANTSEIECLRIFNTKYTTSDINSFCENACPQQCNTFNYLLQTSKVSYPSFKYLKLLQTSSYYPRKFPQNVSDSELIEFARNGLVKFSINNANSYITCISETPVMDSNQLFAFLGGQLGIHKFMSSYKTLIISFTLQGCSLEYQF